MSNWAEPKKLVEHVMLVQEHVEYFGHSLMRDHDFLSQRSFLRFRHPIRHSDVAQRFVGPEMQSLGNG